jgi:hypothetical protein
VKPQLGASQVALYTLLDLLSSNQGPGQGPHENSISFLTPDLTVF